MVALCFSTSFVVMSPPIDMATSHRNTLAKRVPRENGPRMRTAFDREEDPRAARPRNLARRRVGAQRTPPHVSARRGRAQEQFTGTCPLATRRTYKADP